ncbi:hypothetical protein HF860_16080 [Enterococcus gallinarum]|nr:hypothetical protein [Enterococcus gallinarum]
MRTYHYSVRIGHGKATFPTVTLRSLLKSLTFHKGHGVQFLWLTTSQTYLSALFNCQRSMVKAYGFHNIITEQERGEILNHALLKTVYSSGSMST